MKTSFLFSIFVFLFFACSKDNESGSITENSELAEKLRSHPETLKIDNQNYFLTTFISRDFFLTIEPNENKMTGVISLTEMDSLTIPSSFSLERVYIIKGDEIFTSTFKTTNRDADYILSGTFFNGPKWETKIEVDVVCVFRNNNSNTKHNILAKSQFIHETH